MPSEPDNGTQPQDESEKVIPTAVRTPEPKRVAIASSESFEYKDTRVYWQAQVQSS